MNINEKVENFLKEYNLLKKNNTLLVAFSGGYDSMCLLHIINLLSGKYGFKITAIHLNHNWRGSESDKEELNCKKFAEINNIEFYSEILSSEIPHNETSARNARYDFFKKCAEKFNSECVLTAHNADDNAETVLYRIIKGTGTSGLEGIKAHRGIFYRPLLKVTRQEIEKYCGQNGLNPNKDSSNYDTKYRRNYIRHKIFPLLEKINPDCKNAINSLSNIASTENQYFDGEIKEYILTLDNSISAKQFDKLALPVKQRIIMQIYKDFNLTYDKENIEYLLDFITENKKSKSGKICSITDNLWLFSSEKEIKLITENKQTKMLTRIDGCGEYNLGNCTFSIQPYTEKTSFPDDKSNTAFVNFDGYEIKFVLRNRCDGDFICPLGISGKQKLKKYLNNKKVPNYRKEKLLFLCKGNESLGISEKIKVKNNPTHELKLIRNK